MILQQVREGPAGPAGQQLVSAEECDDLLSQYKTFSVKMRQEHAAEFIGFTPFTGPGGPDGEQRLDTFLNQYIKGTEFANL